MTDDRAEDRIDIIERWLAATDQCVPVFALRWLVGEYDRQGAEIAELKRRLDEERLDKAKFLMGAEGIR